MCLTPPILEKIIMTLSTKLLVKPLKVTAVAFLSAALFVSSVALSPSPALAGFEWRPPQDIIPVENNDSVTINDRAFLNTGPIAVERSLLPVFTELEVAPKANPSPNVASKSVLPTVTRPVAPSPVSVTTPDFEQKKTIVIDGRDDGSPLDLRSFSNTEKQAHNFNAVAPTHQSSIAKNSSTPLRLALPEPRSFSEASSRENSLYQIAEGFGRDLPFAIAARQIVPEDYEFDMQDGVVSDTLVSWQGGKPWRDVLSEVASLAGLDFEVNSGVVSVFQQNKAQETLFAQTIDEMRSAVDAQIDDGDTILTAADRQEPSIAIVEVPDIEAVVAVEPETDVVEDSAFEEKKIARPLVRVQEDRNRVEPVKELPAVAFAHPNATMATNNSVWFGARDSSLRAVLKDWSSKANVELYWDSEFDYPIRTNVVVEGTFEVAVRKLLEGFDEAQPRPLGRLHKNSEQGPSVLIVEANDLID